MAPRIGVAVIHGMGSQDARFARRFEAELVAALKREKAKPADVAIQPTWWADVVAPLLFGRARGERFGELVVRNRRRERARRDGVSSTPLMPMSNSPRCTD